MIIIRIFNVFLHFCELSYELTEMRLLSWDIPQEEVCLLPTRSRSSSLPCHPAECVCVCVLTSSDSPHSVLCWLIILQTESATKVILKRQETGGLNWAARDWTRRIKNTLMPLWPRYFCTSVRTRTCVCNASTAKSLPEDDNLLITVGSHSGSHQRISSWLFKSISLLPCETADVLCCLCPTVSCSIQPRQVCVVPAVKQLLAEGLFRLEM